MIENFDFQRIMDIKRYYKSYLSYLYEKCVGKKPNDMEIENLFNTLDEGKNLPWQLAPDSLPQWECLAKSASALSPEELKNQISKIIEENPLIKRRYDLLFKQTELDRERLYLGKLGKVTGVALGAVVVGGGIAYLWDRHRKQQHEREQPHQDTPWTERITPIETSTTRNL